MQSSARWLPLAALACIGCTDHLVGFEAGYASNTLSVRAAPPSGAVLQFTMPATGGLVNQEPVAFEPKGALVQLQGYLPMQPDAIEPAGDGYEVRMTLPSDLVKRTDRWYPEPVHVTGSLYLPTRGISSATSASSEGAWQVGVSLDAVYAGPMTRLQMTVRRFLRGLYSAR